MLFKLPLYLLCFSLFLFNSSIEAKTTLSTSIYDKKINKSPFFDFIKKKDIKALKTIIAAGRDVNEKDEETGYTPFMTAIYYGDVRTIKLFVKAGGDLEIEDKWGNKGLHFAFLDREDRSPAVKYLLTLNPDLNSRNSNGFTPFLIAAYHDLAQSLELLIKAGVDLEQKESNEKTALYLAAENESPKALKLLVKKGANIEARDKWSFTPLMAAAFENHYSMIKTLIELGADRNACTTKDISVSIKKIFSDFFSKTAHIPIGSTALDIAKQFEKSAAIEALQ